jgi:ABC-type branched-subunit amino acid transport system ATPase component
MVRETLLEGTYRRTTDAKTQARLAGVFEAFPRLKVRVRQLAGTMDVGRRAGDAVHWTRINFARPEVRDAYFGRQ